jgi:hypothetical protein
MFLAQLPEKIARKGLLLPLASLSTINESLFWHLICN